MNTNEELVDHLKKLKDKCLEGCSIDDLKLDLFDVIQGYQYKIPGVTHMTIFRSRNFYDSPIPRDNIREYVHPLPHLVKENQRANRAFFTMFYGSLLKEAAVCEINPEIGDYISILALENKDKSKHILLCPFGYDHEALVSEGVRRRDPPIDIYTRENVSHLDRNKIVQGFFSEIYTDRSKQFYNLSIAITESCLTAAELHGIIYPSIAFGLSSTNLALKDSSVGLFTYTLEDSPLYYYKVIGKNIDKFELQPVARLKEMDTRSGLIEWQFAQ
jgi:hypothetical protein